MAGGEQLPTIKGRKGILNFFAFLESLDSQSPLNCQRVLFRSFLLRTSEYSVLIKVSHVPAVNPAWVEPITKSVSDELSLQHAVPADKQVA